MNINKMMFLKASCIALLGSAAVVSAVKDDEYYRAGMVNPNTDLKMYWADAHNVLQDLDQFSTLYIEYHNCAWSQNRATSEEEESGSGDETDYWYIGATPTYAANVAFSLYGSLAGETFEGCNEDTFINSFTTNQGFEAFAQAIYYAGVTDTDYSESYSSECEGGAGIVCDYNYGFAYAYFSSDTCDPAYATGTSDSLSYMNSAFQAAQCIQIYDSATFSYNYNNGDDDANNYNRDLKEQEKEESKNVDNSNNDRNLEDAAAYGNNGYSGYGYSGYGYNAYANNYYNYYGTALSLLYYSNACFVQNYWSTDSGCPDPYGVLSEYQQNFNKGVRMSMKIDTYGLYRANMQKGKKYVKIGAVFFMTALVMFVAEQMMAFKAKKRARGVKSGPTSKSKKSVVELVSTTGKNVKRSASKGVKKALAQVSKAKKKGSGTRGESDGIMVELPETEKKTVAVEIPDETAAEPTSPTEEPTPEPTSPAKKATSPRKKVASFFQRGKQ